MQFFQFGHRRLQPHKVFLLTTILIVGSACLATPHKLWRRGKLVHPASHERAARAFAGQIIKAYGGAEVVRKLAYSGSRSIGKVVDYSIMSNASNSFDCTELSKGEKMRIELNMMGVPEVTGFNGERGWIKQGDQLLETTPAMNERIKDDLEHDGLLLLVKLLKPNTKLVLLPEKKVLGKVCQSLQVTVGTETPTVLYADKSTHLILKSESQGVDAELGIATLKTYVYEDYRPLAGSFMPYKVTEYSGSKKVSEMLTSKIECTDLDDQIFALPSNQVAVLAKDEEIRLPFDYISNEIVVKARANNQEDLLLIVDTGATQSVIDRSIAQKLGGFKDSSLKMTTGSGSMALGYMTLSGLLLDSVTLKNLPFAVTDLSSFSQILGKRPGGLIGADILRRFLVTIDYENQELILAHPDSEIEVPPDAIVLPTKPTLGMSGILLEGELDGEKLPFLVDSGAAFNNISTKLADKILKRTNAPVLPVGIVEGLDGKKVNIGCAQFKHLKIGSLNIDNPVFSVAPADSNPAGVIATGDLAILGNPLWCRFKTTIDYKHERLILSRSPEVIESEPLVNRLQKLEISLILVPAWRDRLYRLSFPDSGWLPGAQTLGSKRPDAGKMPALPGSGAGRLRHLSDAVGRLPGVSADFGSTGVGGTPALPGSDAGKDAGAPRHSLAGEGLGYPLTGLHSHDPLPASLFETLQTILSEAKEEDLPGVAALCLSDIAIARAEQELGSASPMARSRSAATRSKKEMEKFQEIGALFREAEDLAEQCEARQIQAQILAKWAMYYLTYLPKPQSTQAAKPLLGKAMNCWGTEPSVYTATAYYLLQFNEDKTADKLVDQALMLDPTDKQALLLKYDLAVRQGNKQMQALLDKQLLRN